MGGMERREGNNYSQIKQINISKKEGIYKAFVVLIIGYRKI